MDKVLVFKSTRKIISVSRNGGFIHTQSIKFSRSPNGDGYGLNSQGNRRGMNSASRDNLSEGAREGFGKSSQRNLRKCIDVFFWGCRRSNGINPITKKRGYFAGNFITLTIPDLHTIIDSKIGYERLLKAYIKWIVKQFGVGSYVWKFEWQERGQGHWHIFTDRYCDQDILRKEWLRILDKCGLVDDWKAKYDYDSIYCCKVKGLKSEKQVKEYLEKYMSKSSQNSRGTEGRTWGASMWIKKAERMKIPVTDAFLTNLDLACATGSFIKKDIVVNEKDSNGEAVVDINGKGKEFIIGTSYWSDNWTSEILLCREQKVWYDRYIRAYREKDWKETIRLGIDLDRVERDYRRYTESVEYIGRERLELSDRLSNRLIKRLVSKKRTVDSVQISFVPE